MMRHSFFYIKKIGWYNSISLLIAIFLLPSVAHSSNDYLSEEKKEIIQQIQANIYLDEYQLAHTYADSLITFNTNDPLGYLFKAAIYLGDMTDSEQELYPDQFKEMIDTTIYLSDRIIASADSTKIAWSYLCVGHAAAYKSLYESRFGSMGQALKYGFKAKSAYHDGLRFDSTVYDLYGGLGMYHYWKSAKAGFLRWIGVFNDDKQKGIDELYLTIDSSEVSADAAWSSLVWIYLDAKQYDTAIVIAQKMYEKYPEGKTFLWAMAKIYFQSEQYEKSIEVFQLLYDKLMLTHKNYFNIIESEHYIFSAYKNLGDKEKAKEIAKRCLHYVNKIPMKIRNDQRDKIKELVKVATG